MYTTTWRRLPHPSSIQHPIKISIPSKDRERVSTWRGREEKRKTKVSDIQERDKKEAPIHHTADRCHAVLRPARSSTVSIAIVELGRAAENEDGHRDVKMGAARACLYRMHNWVDRPDRKTARVKFNDGSRTVPFYWDSITYDGHHVEWDPPWVPNRSTVSTNYNSMRFIIFKNNNLKIYYIKRDQFKLKIYYCVIIYEHPSYNMIEVKISFTV